MTTSPTLLPDSGRSRTRRWYRLCTRRETVLQDGHAADSFDARTVIVVVVASWIALTTTKPLGTNENGRNDRCMVLILPAKSARGGQQTSSKVSQSPIVTRLISHEELVDQ
jgi:hypothetical protein